MDGKIREVLNFLPEVEQLHASGKLDVLSPS